MRRGDRTPTSPAERASRSRGPMRDLCPEGSGGDHARHDREAALDDGCRHPRIGDRVPGRHRRERRAAEDRARAAGDRHRRPRGPDLRQQRLPGDPVGTPDPVGRPERLLRPPPDVRDRAGRLRGHVGPVRAGAQPRAPGAVPGAPGSGGRGARAGLAFDHHCDLRWCGPSQGVRDLGSRDLGHHDARTHPGRLPRRHALLEGRLPDQRSARRPGAVRHARPHGRNAGRERLRPIRLAGRVRDRGCRRRSRIRGHPRPGNAMERPERVHRPGDRGRRAGRWRSRS